MSKKKKTGKYYTHVEPRLTEIQAWARDGLIDKQIAHNLGIAYSTFRNYRDEHEAFSAALKKGKAVTDIEVENQLHKKAMGFEYDEVETWIEEVDGKQKKVIKKRKKYALPDTTAQIFWLKNRKPEQWRDRHEVKNEVTGNLSIADNGKKYEKYFQEMNDE